MNWPMNVLVSASLIRRVLFRRFCKNEDEGEDEVEAGVDVGGFMVDMVFVFR